MKALLLGFAATLALSSPVIAQTVSSQSVVAPLTIESPIEALVADTKAKAVIDANFPGMTSHPAYDQFKAMTLKQLQPMSQGVITDEAIAKAAAALVPAQ